MTKCKRAASGRLHFKIVVAWFLLRANANQTINHLPRAITEDEAGLDRVGRNPVQPYYLPGADRSDKSHAFIRFYGLKDADFKKHALNT